MVRYDHQKVGVRQGNRKGHIAPGQCGFRGCNNYRIGGVWDSGGSYMCDMHRILLMPLRIHKGEGLNQKEKRELREKEGLAAD